MEQGVESQLVYMVGCLGVVQRARPRVSEGLGAGKRQLLRQSLVFLIIWPRVETE